MSTRPSRSVTSSPEASTFAHTSASRSRNGRQAIRGTIPPPSDTCYKPRTSIRTRKENEMVRTHGWLLVAVAALGLGTVACKKDDKTEATTDKKVEAKDDKKADDKKTDD